jgi:hypothetical protein
MSDINERRIFEIDSSSLLFPDNCWNFHQDGKMIPEDREKFFAEFIQYGNANAHQVLKNYELEATEEIAKILKAEAKSKPETDKEKKARWIEGQQKDARDFYELQKDLRAWNNDSDEPRPSINWRELEMYGV